MRWKRWLWPRAPSRGRVLVCQCTGTPQNAPPAIWGRHSREAVNLFLIKDFLCQLDSGLASCQPPLCPFLNVSITGEVLFLQTLPTPTTTEKPTGVRRTPAGAGGGAGWGPEGFPEHPSAWELRWTLPPPCCGSPLHSRAQVRAAATGLSPAPSLQTSQGLPCRFHPLLSRPSSPQQLKRPLSIIRHTLSCPWDENPSRCTPPSPASGPLH